jgi:hypothetical protein
VLELRPNCELCDADLPPASQDARICSYECTFCVDCAERELRNVCPNCGGGLVTRPIRPRTTWRPGLGLRHDPAATERKHIRYPRDEIAAFVDRIHDIAPHER